MRSRPGFPTRRASALICMAALIANVIKASSPRAAHKGRTYGRTAPVWGQQRKRVPLTAGSFHIWESQESVSQRVGIRYGASQTKTTFKSTSVGWRSSSWSIYAVIIRPLVRFDVNHPRYPYDFELSPRGEPISSSARECRRGIDVPN